jgi:hypothetical protein
MSPPQIVNPEFMLPPEIVNPEFMSSPEIVIPEFKGRFVQGAQHPRTFGRGHIGRGHINPASLKLLNMVCVIQLVFAAQVLQIFKMCLPLSPGKPHINFQGVSVQCQGVLTKV